MKKSMLTALVFVLVLPSVLAAGPGAAPSGPPVPTLGEASLVGLGIALLGAGVAVLRRRKP